MPRAARIVPDGLIFHVLNRGNARSQIFEHDRDYDALKKSEVISRPIVSTPPLDNSDPRTLTA
jgi:hypothetical protein